MESQKILFAVIFRLIKFTFGFIFFYIIVLFFIPQVIGTVQVAIAFVAIFSFIFNLRFDVAHLKIYPEEDNKAECIGALFILKIISTILALIFYFTFLFYFEFEPVLTILIIIFVFEQITQSLSNGLMNILIADGEMIKSQFPWLINAGSRIVILIFGIIFFELNEYTLASAYILSTIIHFLILIIYLLPYKISKPNKVLLRKYLKFTYPLSIQTIFILVSTNIAIILIDIWIYTEAVAFYYVGKHLADFRTIIPNLIILIFIPIFTKNVMANKLEKNKQIIKKVSRYSCLLFAMIIMLAFLYSNYIIINFIGETYYQSVFIFNILILSQIIYINDIAVYADLNARGYTKLYSTLNILGEAYSIFLTVLFIAPNGLNLGINGIALAQLFRHATYSPILRLFLWKKFNYSYNFDMFLFLFSAFIVYLLNSLLLPDINLFIYFYLIPLLAMINIILYFGILFIIRGLKKEDLRYIKLFLNFKQLINLLYRDLSLKKGINNTE